MKRKFIYTWYQALSNILLLIGAGSKESFAVDSDKQTWAWGYNLYGQLGDNSVTSRRTPVSILGNKKTFCEIGGGITYTLGLQHNGQVWSWGYNNVGQLGDNTVTSKRTPVSLLGGKKTFCKIVAGNAHSNGIQHNGQVWCWGNNASGQLGDNTAVSKRTPVSLLGGKKTFCEISGGVSYSIAIQHNGQVWGWGHNGYGQLGVNSVTSRCTPVSILGAKKTFCQITGGKHYYTMAIQHNGQVWCWGLNNIGQLGDNSVTSRRTPVSLLGGKKTFCQISGGQYHSLGLQHNGQVWCWGDNTYGQLGDKSLISKRTPVSIHGTKKTFCKISSGENHSLGLDKDGIIWGWGFNDFGQLGNNMIYRDRKTPISILGSPKNFIKISAGFYNSFGIDGGGYIWGWGDNAYGQVGDNTLIDKYTPTPIKKTFCEISNAVHSMGIDHTGQVWAWGYNDNGQLGVNSTTSSRTPRSILGGKKTFCRIDAGGFTTVAIQHTGLVWCWGINTYGQLGDFSITNRCTPVSVLGLLRTFFRVAAGGNHTAGLTTTGDALVWGYNNYGQIGDNSITSRRTPANFAGNRKTFCKIDAGNSHTVTIQHNGQVWCWGYNLNGQLGDNSITSRRTPISILGVKKTFCEISAGDSFTTAIQHNGQVWSWGFNGQGQLGVNSTTSSRTPRSIFGAKKTFCQISAGSNYVMAIDYTGKLWGWGDNQYQQLGDRNFYTPIRVCNI